MIQKTTKKKGGRRKKKGGEGEKRGLLQATMTQESSPLKSSNNHQNTNIKLETIASGADKRELIS